MDTLHYKCHKIILKRGALNVDSSDWITNKRATKNPKKNYNNCFRYPATLKLRHKEIRKNS